MKLARGIRVLHREYGFRAPEILKMSISEYRFWLESLSEETDDSGSQPTTREIWTNIE